MQYIIITEDHLYEFKHKGNNKLISSHSFRTIETCNNLIRYRIRVYEHETAQLHGET